MNTNESLMGVTELAFSLDAEFSSCNSKDYFKSVSIDSRTVEEGALFFALQGNICDGHAFVDAAFKKGACAAVVERSKIKSFNLTNISKGKNLIIVADSLKALHDSAGLYLDKFPKLLKIGITGSCGKTTTKEIAVSIISAEKNTVMNKGNFNSETGLPLSIFGVRDFHEAGIFEIGISAKGDMLSLSKILRPNIALITNIGTAHIASFGSRKEILNEKKRIFDFLKDEDTALIPDKDEFKKELAEGVIGKVKFYGKEAFEELGAVRSLGLEGTQIEWAGEKIHFALPGKHSLDDAVAAISIARLVPVSNDAIKRGLESVKPLFGRLEILKGRTTVLRDCYNANPESTAKSIEFCDSLEWEGRRIYVIADMLELGEFSEDAHLNIGKVLAHSKADKIFLFGTEIKATVDSINNTKPVFYTDNINILSNELDRYVQSKDIVLLKGSRLLSLERLSNMLTEAKDVS